MHMLIWIFAGRTCPKIHFLTLWLIVFFSEKINLSISCESSTSQMIHMKCQALLFSEKKKTKNFLSDVILNGVLINGQLLSIFFIWTISYLTSAMSQNVPRSVSQMCFNIPCITKHALMKLHFQRKKRVKWSIYNESRYQLFYVKIKGKGNNDEECTRDEHFDANLRKVSIRK